MKPIFHLLPNAHLDPVWLWDWREGLNEGISTCRAVLDLMDKFPALTFLRGEAAIYRHIEHADPATFARIETHIQAGRWDAVGGVWVQPDTNLPATRTLLRHFQAANTYFQNHFGARPRIAWAADSFGRSAGLPEILAASGMEGIAFTRPFDAPHDGAFWWEGAGGSRVLAYRPLTGWYGCERDEMPRRLTALLAMAEERNLQNIGVLFGLGNHGGGPSRRHIEDVMRWQEEHTDVEVRFSTLHGLFAALLEEERSRGENWPVHHGELNFCLRGCYSTAAAVKFSYRRAEAMVASSETSATVISAALQTSVPDLTRAWEGVLFNSFHDILPGTSIERALDEQTEWLGGVIHEARTTQFAMLNALAQRLDTSVAPVEGDVPSAVPFLVWNPHPHEYSGLVEIEACLDARPLFAYYERTDAVPLEVRDANGQILPFQTLRTEHDFMPRYPWRKRVLVPLTLPPLGWKVVTLGYVEGAQVISATNRVLARCEDDEFRIQNERFGVAACRGGETIEITRDGQEWASLRAIVMEDPWGSWGSLEEETESLHINTPRAVWRVREAAILEEGPLRAVLWLRLADDSGRSWLELTLALGSEALELDASARVLWNERAARLKLEWRLPSCPTAEFEVPGATVRREPCGEVPGGRWVRVPDSDFGFASDALYNFDMSDDCLRATIVRATRYAASERMEAHHEPWRPALDNGALKFRFVVSDAENIARLSRELEQPLVALAVPATPGDLPREGSLLRVPEQWELLSLQPQNGGLRAEVFVYAECEPMVKWCGQTQSVTPIGAGHIGAFFIETP